jgi:hypothetical protein
VFWKPDNNYFLWFLLHNDFLGGWTYYYLFPTYLLLPEDKSILDIPHFLTKENVELVKSWGKGTQEIPVWLEAHGITTFEKKRKKWTPKLENILKNINYEYRCSVVRSRQSLSPDLCLKIVSEEINLLRGHGGDYVISCGKIKAPDDWKYVEMVEDPEHNCNDYLQYLLRDGERYRKV